MSETPYRIDLAGVRKAFPLWLEAPPLLVDFAAWLEGRAWGGLGCFDLVGQFSDNAPLFDSSLLRNEFALFMRLPDGSAVGTWYPDIGNAELAPVVLIDSEGQNKILAPSLEAFLAKLASLQFEDSDLYPHEDSDDQTDELAAWLRKRLGVKDLGLILRAAEPVPDFADAMEKWCRAREGLLVGSSRHESAVRAAVAAPACRDESLGPDAFRGRHRRRPIPDQGVAARPSAGRGSPGNRVDPAGPAQ